MTEIASPAVDPDAFGLGTFATSSRVFVGLVRGDQVHDVSHVVGRDASLRDVLADWDAALDALVAIAPRLDSGTAIADLHVLPPVQPVGQVLCAGANYRRHVEQIVQTSLRNSGDPRTDDELRDFAIATIDRQATTDPLMFIGLPSAVSGARDDVVLWTPGTQHDWELELAVIVKKPAFQVDTADAMDYVAGYVMSNDVSVRDVMARPQNPLTDFVTSKNRPTYFPTGPFILPARFVPDYRRLRILLKVNGEVMQDESVSDIIHGVEKCVSYASHSTYLSAGDMILTGSPAGNAGHHGNRWLRPGDVMEGSITGLGAQITKCVASPSFNH
jgi:2,4-diketo-3-deoxy-L-fuconate hydrolase